MERCSMDDPINPRERSFFRIVKGDPTSPRDFTSNAAQGKQPRNPTHEVLRRWDGLSAFTSLEAALANARIFPRLGNFIAELRIDEGGPITWEPHPGPDQEHVTLWGPVESFLEAVIRVVRIR
jgi:hypothetical protein